MLDSITKYWNQNNDLVLTMSVKVNCVIHSSPITVMCPYSLPNGQRLGLIEVQLNGKGGEADSFTRNIALVFHYNESCACLVINC